MLKLYYTPLSLNARRVWVALLEKQIAFEAIELNLDGDQFGPDFLAINPFHRIPVLIDGDLTLVESLAILDYLQDEELTAFTALDGENFYEYTEEDFAKLDSHA